MKISVTVLATALLLASPAFAAAPKAKKEIPVQCEKVTDIEKEVAGLKGEAKIEYKLSGDELKKLNEVIEKKSGGQATAPEGIDTLIILSKPGTTVWAGIMFVKGCAVQVFPIRPEAFKVLYELSKTDGKV